MLFFNAFEHRILVDFWRLRFKKKQFSLQENNDFCKMGVFDQGTKIAHFAFVLGGQNEESKNVLLLSIEFEGLFL